MELTLDVDDQDRIIYLCITNTDALSNIIRQKLEPKHFASDVRQKIFKTVADFYRDYKKAPGVDIVSEIESKIRRKRIKEEDREVYEEYLMNVVSIPEFSAERIIDRLNEFTKTRIVTTVTNSLLKLQDRFDIEPDKALSLLKEAIAEADIASGNRVIESIQNDPPQSLKRTDFVTKFNIDPIDRMLGGGFKPTNYAIIQAYLGMGKSWCINHLAKMAVRFGHSPLVIPTEMANRTARLRFRMSFTGLKEDEIYERLGDVKRQVRVSMNKGADIYLVSEEEKSMHVDELPSIVEDAETKTGKDIKLILIDSPDDLLPPSGKRYEGDISSNTAIHTFLKNYAKNEEKCIIGTAQVQRIGEEKFWCGPNNVGDNINKFRKATVGISINGVPDEKKRWLYRLWLFKNTDGKEGAKVWCKRDFERGQFVTKYSYFTRSDQYNDWMIRQAVLDKDGGE